MTMLFHLPSARSALYGLGVCLFMSSVSGCQSSSPCALTPAHLATSRQNTEGVQIKADVVDRVLPRYAYGRVLVIGAVVQNNAKGPISLDPTRFALIDAKGERSKTLNLTDLAKKSRSSGLGLNHDDLIRSGGVHAARQYSNRADTRYPSDLEARESIQALEKEQFPNVTLPHRGRSQGLLFFPTPADKAKPWTLVLEERTCVGAVVGDFEPQGEVEVIQ